MVSRRLLRETARVRSWRERAVYHGARWAPLLAVAVLTHLIFPSPTRVASPAPAVGQPIDATVTAPFHFLVLKSDAERALEGEARALGGAAGVPLRRASLRLRARGGGQLLRPAGARRAGRRRGHGPGGRGGGRAARPRRGGAPDGSRAAASGARRAQAVPGRHALPGRRGRGNHARRAEPGDRAPPGRGGAAGAARLHPHVRRPDGPGRRPARRRDGRDRPPRHPAAHRGLLPPDGHLRPLAHPASARGGPRLGGFGEVRRERGGADRDRRPARHRGDPLQAPRPPGRAAPARRGRRRRARVHRRRALQRHHPRHLLAAAPAVPAGKLRAAPGDDLLRRAVRAGGPARAPR